MMPDDVGPVGEVHDVLLRHDVDLSLKRAYALAEVEHEYGIRSTYLVMPNNPFYNVFSPESRDLLAQMIDWKHEIGLHYDARIMMVYEFCAMLSTFLDYNVRVVEQDGLYAQAEKPRLPMLVVPSELKHWSYLSDSGMHWRAGCMCKWLDGNTRLQILTHPIWWSKDLPYRNLEVWERRQQYLNAFALELATDNHKTMNYVMEQMRLHRVKNDYV